MPVTRLFLSNKLQEKQTTDEILKRYKKLADFLKKIKIECL
jgi:hypothetical protein